MNNILLSICFNILIWLSFTFDFNTRDVGIEVLNEQIRRDSSLCFINSENSNTADIEYLSELIANAINRDVIDEEITQASRIIIQMYIEFNKNELRLTNIINQKFVRENCELKRLKDDSISKHVVGRLMTTNSFEIQTCHEFMVLACHAEKLYTDHYEYLNISDINGREQKIANVIYFNDITRKIIAKISKDTSRQILVDETRELMGMISTKGIIPPYYIINCFLMISADIYHRDRMKWVERSYLKLVYEIEDYETCMFSEYDENDLMQLKESFELMNNFDEVDRNIVIFGLEFLYLILDNTNVLNNYENILNISHYWDKNNCIYNYKFEEDFSNLTEFLSFQYNSGIISSIGEYAALFCILSEISNDVDYGYDSLINETLTNITEIYAYLIDSFSKSQDEQFSTWSFMIMKAIRSDSNLINANLATSFKNKQQIFCLLKMYRATNHDHLKPKLDFLMNFVSNQYVFTFCQNYTSDYTLFSQAVSEYLIGVEDEELLTFKYIAKIIENLLDESVDIVEITWKNVYVWYPDCRLDTNISYSSIPFEESTKSNQNDIRNFESSFVNKCNRIISTNKYLEGFNKPVDITDRNLMISTILELKMKLSFNSLDFESKFNIVKNEIADRSTSKLSQGSSERLECEVRKLINFVPDLNDDYLGSIYILISSKLFDIKTCAYQNYMFEVKNRHHLINTIKMLSGFEMTPDDFIESFISNFEKIFSKIKTKLTSSNLTEGVISKLISPITCTFENNDTKLNDLFDKHFEYLYKGKILNWQDYVNVRKCLEVNKVKSYLNALNNEYNLSNQDMETINDIYKRIKIARPDLKEQTIENFLLIYQEMKADSKFIPIRLNIIREYMAKCYTIKIYFDGSNSSSKNKDEFSKIKKSIISSEAIIGIIIGSTTFIVLSIAASMLIYKRLRKV